MRFQCQYLGIDQGAGDGFMPQPALQYLYRRYALDYGVDRKRMPEGMRGDANQRLQIGIEGGDEAFDALDRG